eukprot:scaffold22684_cov63-Phaeocystis_antarctica.AAC.4
MVPRRPSRLPFFLVAALRAPWLAFLGWPSWPCSCHRAGLSVEPGNPRVHSAQGAAREPPPGAYLAERRSCIERVVGGLGANCGSSGSEAFTHLGLGRGDASTATPLAVGPCRGHHGRSLRRSHCRLRLGTRLDRRAAAAITAAARQLTLDIVLAAHLLAAAHRVAHEADAAELQQLRVLDVWRFVVCRGLEEDALVSDLPPIAVGLTRRLRLVVPALLPRPLGALADAAIGRRHAVADRGSAQPRGQPGELLRRRSHLELSVDDLHVLGEVDHLLVPQAGVSLGDGEGCERLVHLPRELSLEHLEQQLPELRQQKVAPLEPEDLADAHASSEQPVNAPLEGVGVDNVLAEQPCKVDLDSRVAVEERHPVVSEPLVDQDGHLQPRRAVELLHLLTLAVDADSRDPLLTKVLSDIGPEGLLLPRQRIVQLAHAGRHGGELEHQPQHEMTVYGGTLRRRVLLRAVEVEWAAVCRWFQLVRVLSVVISLHLDAVQRRFSRQCTRQHFPLRCNSRASRPLLQELEHLIPQCATQQVRVLTAALLRHPR